jgi:hypothetical protein
MTGACRSALTSTVATPAAAVSRCRATCCSGSPHAASGPRIHIAQTAASTSQALSTFRTAALTGLATIYTEDLGEKADEIRAAYPSEGDPRDVHRRPQAR